MHDRKAQKSFSIKISSLQGLGFGSITHSSKASIHFVDLKNGERLGWLSIVTCSRFLFTKMALYGLNHRFALKSTIGLWLNIDKIICKCFKDLNAIWGYIKFYKRQSHRGVLIALFHSVSYWLFIKSLSHTLVLQSIWGYLKCYVTLFADICPLTVMFQFHTSCLIYLNASQQFSQQIVECNVVCIGKQSFSESDVDVYKVLYDLQIWLLQ